MNPFTKYIHPFAGLLENIQVDELDLEAYPSTYLQQLLGHKTYYLHIYAEVLKLAIENAGISKEAITLIDYGCGNGLLGLFAKFCGCKAVYLNDNTSSFLQAARLLGEKLNIEIDDFIPGEIEEVVARFNTQHKPHAIVATDVIEHIYNLEAFFAGVAKLNSKMVSVFTTASVTENYFKSKQLQKLQYKDEHLGSNALHANARDAFAGMPFKEIRRKLISSSAAGLTAENIETLTTATRGLNKHDIMKAVEEFRISKKLPLPPPHATNTCDPITGSWTERLLTAQEYRQLYAQQDFELDVYNGFYNQWNGGLKSGLLKVANSLLGGLPGSINYVSPFIFLVGKRKL